MPEVRSEYPFQVSYEDARLPRSLICLRAETAGELAQAILGVTEALENVLVAPLEEKQPSAPAPPAAPPQPQQAGPQPPEQGSPSCTKCGAIMQWREGENEQGPYRGWVCPNGTRQDRHPAQWL